VFAALSENLETRTTVSSRNLSLWIGLNRLADVLLMFSDCFWFTVNVRHVRVWILTSRLYRDLIDYCEFAVFEYHAKTLYYFWGCGASDARGFSKSAKKLKSRRNRTRYDKRNHKFMTSTKPMRPKSGRDETWRDEEGLSGCRCLEVFDF